MYAPERPRPIHFDKESVGERNMVVDADLPQQMIMEGISGGEDHELRAPKKRAETWVQEETRSLISFRREVDSLFNTSKSNKHLWQQISNKMRDKGFDRSPTMCTDKWRNLLKEFKRAKHQHQDIIEGGGSGGDKIGPVANKIWYYKELDDLLRERTNYSSQNTPPHPSTRVNNHDSASKVDSYIHFSGKAIEDGNMEFAPVEGDIHPIRNPGRPLEQDVNPLDITPRIVDVNGVPPGNWRDIHENGNIFPRGRIISIRLGEYTKRIGIDGSAEAIKEAVKCAFRLRTKRLFWLEDENNVVRCFDRNMPLGYYHLRLDEGISIKICLYEDSEHMAIRAEEKTFYTEEDFRDFLVHRGLIGLREINSYRCIDTLDDLSAGAVYEGVRLLGGE